MRRAHVVLLHARRRAAVDAPASRPRRDDVDLLRGEDARRRERHAEHRLDDHARGSGRARAARRAPARGSPSSGRPSSASRRARRLGDVVGRLALAHRLQQGDHLQQRVVAHLRRRGVARRRRSVRHGEAEDALLGDAHAVERARRRRGRRAPAPSLSRQSQRTRSGWFSVSQIAPSPPPVSSSTTDDDEQVAARRAPARARERDGGDRPRRPSGTSCPARRGPTARRRRRRPTTGRAASRPGRRARCRRGRAGRASGRRRAPRRRATRFGPLLGASEQRRPRSPRRASRPASSSWAARSLPGGLTVLKRTRRWSSSVVSRSSRRPRTQATTGPARRGGDPRDQQHGGDRAHELDSDRRPVSREPSSAPGIDAAAPSAGDLQSGGADGRWPIAPATPTQKPTARFVPATRARALADESSAARGIRSEPRIRPDDPAEQADERAR